MTPRAQEQPDWPARTSPDDHRRNRLLLANSSVALALAAPITVTLHELGHAVTGVLHGSVAVLSSNSVSYVPPLADHEALVAAAAGPLASLVLGVVLYLVSRRAGLGFGRLLLLWSGLVAMQNFAGYLVIAPFARAGDTGQVMETLGAPALAYVVVALLGAGLTLLNSRLLAGQVTRYARSRQEAKRLVLLPWLIATGITVALTALDAVIGGLGGADLPVVLSGAFAIAIFAPMFTFFYRPLHPPYEHLRLSAPVVPLVVLVVVDLVVAAVVAPGLPLG